LTGLDAVENSVAKSLKALETQPAQRTVSSEETVKIGGQRQLLYSHK